MTYLFDKTGVVAAKDQVSRDMAGEAAILNLTSGVYYGLNPIGARIWNLIQEPKTLGEINETILREYEVNTDRCEADVRALLSQLAEQGLVEIAT